MLVDLLCSGNLVSYNSRIAQMIGLHPAIYLSELLTIEDKATRKSKKKNNYFTLDRNYMESRTTFSVDEQLQIDKCLIELGILVQDEEDKSMMTIDVSKLTSLFMTDDEEIIDKIKVVSTKKKRVTKQEGMIIGLQSHITCTNEELRTAYCDWIESTVSKSGWLSKAAVELAQQCVDNFSQRDLDIALDVVHIAALNGWRDMNWAIQRYQEQRKNLPKVVNPQPQNRTKLGDETF